MTTPRARLRRPPSERAPRPSQAKPPDNDVPRLLVDRRQAAKMLSLSEFSIRRFEAAGILRPIKLNPFTPNAKVHFKITDIVGLIESRAAGE